MSVLTAIDLLGIQRFVFASNRLRDAVGASKLVNSASLWEGDSPLQEIPPERRLMAAGGNAAVIFDDIDRARDFAGRYSRWLYDHAPGLEAAIVHRPFAEGELAAALCAIQIDLARSKMERRPSAPLLGLSVTESCHETGLPAVGRDRLGSDPPAPVSRVTRRVRDAYKNERATSRWQHRIDEQRPHINEPLVFPRELDDLGRTEQDTSLLAVVHIDGNNVGRRITEWLGKQRDDGRSDVQVREGYAELSKQLDRLVSKAMTAVLARVVEAIRPDDQNKVMVRGAIDALCFEPRVMGAEDDDTDAGVCMPVRPVLVGGDDLTFVCDGRLALDLAETALAVFEGGTSTVQLGVVTACAGVAIVRSHAPFYRACELAERLCGEAKALLRKEERDDGCALDWHLGTTRPGESIGAIRARQYEGATLTARPMRLGRPEEVGTWRWLDTALLSPTGDRSLRGPAWRERRNKVKALRELARDGKEAVRSALEAWQVVAPELSLPADMPNGFLDGDHSPLLDAIELLDIHLPLGHEEAPR